MLNFRAGEQSVIELKKKQYNTKNKNTKILVEYYLETILVQSL